VVLVVRELHSAPAAPAIATAAAISPLSGATKMPSPSATSTATARRAVPTPGSTTARITPGVATYCTLLASASAPARTSCAGMPWVRSMTLASGAIERMTEWTTPTNSSSRP
jgi:hypothetical protein